MPSRRVWTLLVALWLIASSGAAQAQDRPYRRMFGEGHQQLLTAEGDAARISLLRTECGNCVNGPIFVFEVADKVRRSLRQVKLYQGPAQIDEIRIAPNGTAILLGRMDANLGQITLLDLETADVLKRFVAYDPSISDDNRLIAFVKPYALHFNPDATNTYMVYDVERLWPGGRDAEFKLNMNAGQILYPKSVEGGPHLWASDGFYWLGKTHILAWADHGHSAVSLVIADLRQGLEHPVLLVQTLDNADVFASTKCGAVTDPANLFRITGAAILSADPVRASFTLEGNHNDGCPLKVTTVETSMH